MQKVILALSFMFASVSYAAEEPCAVCGKQSALEEPNGLENFRTIAEKVAQPLANARCVSYAKKTTLQIADSTGEITILDFSGSYAPPDDICNESEQQIKRGADIVCGCEKSVIWYSLPGSRSYENTLYCATISRDGKITKEEIQSFSWENVDERCDSARSAVLGIPIIHMRTQQDHPLPSRPVRAQIGYRTDRPFPNKGNFKH